MFLLCELLFQLGVPKAIVIDNETSLNSASISFMLEDTLGIQIYKTPPNKSSVNGQIEHFHSTLTELMLCLKVERSLSSFPEPLGTAIYEYSYTKHSAVGRKPIELFFR